MRVLLVNPAFPETYWSLTRMLALVKRRWLVAPLALITLAGMLPSHWRLRLIDMEVEPLHDGDIRRADVVMLTGMIVQRDSLKEVLRRCKRLGVRTVVGGPYATSLPEELEDADTLFLGEAEQGIGELVRDLELGAAERFYREDGKPDLSTSPIPRYDLLRKNVYHYLAIQFSRGCPYLCEFCDITTLYGRRPRTKAPAQLLAELDALHATGFRGRVMFVDDNFIGNQRAARDLLPHIAEWRARTRAPLDFFTEASINRADQPGLVDGMTAAGFAAVFAAKFAILSSSPGSL